MKSKGSFQKVNVKTLWNFQYVKGGWFVIIQLGNAKYGKEQYDGLYVF